MELRNTYRQTLYCRILCSYGFAHALKLEVCWNFFKGVSTDTA